MLNIHFCLSSHFNIAIALTLHDCHGIIQRLYLNQHAKGNEEKLIASRGIMSNIMIERHKLISNKLPMMAVRKVQHKVACYMDYFNREHGLDLVVRDEEGIALSPLQ